MDYRLFVTYAVVFLLVTLSTFNVSRNSITGSVPSTLGNLTLLRQAKLTVPLACLCCQFDPFGVQVLGPQLQRP